MIHSVWYSLKASVTEFYFANIYELLQLTVRLERNVLWMKTVWVLRVNWGGQRCQTPFIWKKAVPTCTNQKRILKRCHPHRHITCGLLSLFMILLMSGADCTKLLRPGSMFILIFARRPSPQMMKTPLLGFISTFRD